VHLWLWGNTEDHRVNGTFLATSKDLLHWKKIGIVFPNAKRTHRNAVVLQNPHNEAVRVNGKFVMYINFGLMAYSDDMVHRESKDVDRGFPNEECCIQKRRTGWYRAMPIVSSLTDWRFLRGNGGFITAEANTRPAWQNLLQID
jgi:hypothetical protein